MGNISEVIVVYLGHTKCIFEGKDMCHWASRVIKITLYTCIYKCLSHCIFQPFLIAFMHVTIFMPPRSNIGGHIVFVLSVIPSLCLLSENLTLLITFEQWMLELWYFTWVFLVIRPFRGYHYFLPCDLDLGVFHMNIPCDEIFL